MVTGSTPTHNGRQASPQRTTKDADGTAVTADPQPDTLDTMDTLRRRFSRAVAGIDHIEELHQILRISRMAIAFKARCLNTPGRHWERAGHGDVMAFHCFGESLVIQVV